jgi:hypothetical protein
MQRAVLAGNTAFMKPSMGLFKTDDGRLTLFNNAFDLLPTKDADIDPVISPNSTYGANSFQRAVALLSMENVVEGVAYINWLKANDTTGAWHGLLGVLEILHDNGFEVPEAYLAITMAR